MRRFESCRGHFSCTALHGHGVRPEWAPNASGETTITPSNDTQRIRNRGNLDHQPEVPELSTQVEGSSGNRPRYRKTSTLVAAVLALLLVIAAGALLIKHRRDNAPVSLPHAMVSIDRTDTYRFHKVRDHITVSASPGNRGWNLRTVFWLPDATPSVNQQVCIDWPDHDGRAQPGIALRVRPSADGSQADGIYVMQNVWDQDYWKIAVLGAKDNYLDTDNRLTVFNVRMLMLRQTGVARRGTWRVRARVVGQQVPVKLWFAGQPEPSWKAGPGVRHATLPATWVWAGLPGAYVGHIKPTESFNLANLRTAVLPDP